MRRVEVGMRSAKSGVGEGEDRFAVGQFFWVYGLSVQMLTDCTREERQAGRQEASSGPSLWSR